MKKVSLYLIFQLIMVLFCGITYGDWQITTVDSAISYSYGRIAIEVDRDNNPGIAYSEFAPLKAVKFAKKNNGVWINQIIKPFNGQSQMASLAFDSNSYPRITSVDYSKNHSYSEWNGSSWVTQTFNCLPTDGDIKIDALDNTHIAWYKSSDLEYRYWNGSSWQVTIVDSYLDTGYGAKLELDSQNRIYIVYGDYPSKIRFAYYNGTNWLTEFLDTSSLSYASHNIALDNNNNPHIMYIDGDNSIKIASKVNGIWQYQTLPFTYTKGVSSGDFGFRVDQNNVFHISFCVEESGNYYLKYYKYFNNVWESEIIEHFENIDMNAPCSSDIVVSQDNRIHVAYTDSYNVEVKYATNGTVPVSNAGEPQTVHIGSIVTLDGSLSSDPDGDVPLSYAWNISVKPDGSNAALYDPASVSPIFSPDVPGDYIVELVVTDSTGAQSAPGIVTISTYNTAPIAEAGPDQPITLIGSTVQLDATQSYDDDGDHIEYDWTFASLPTGSAAILNGANTATPNFVVDVYGTYVVQLKVSDPWVGGDPDLVSITFDNVRPVANAGTSLSTEVFQTVTLNGSGSTDANGDPLTYNWSLVSVPQGSTTTIPDPTTINTSFIPDREGAYVVQLTVNDGLVTSEASAIQVEAVVYLSTVTQSIQQIQSLVLAIPVTNFKNKNMQNTLLNKLNAVIYSIQAGYYFDALEQLENDILGKTNGCAIYGTPDNNDWIKTGLSENQICSSQNQLYTAIIQSIYLLESLIQ